jgi:hypothetical protein
MCGRSVHGKNTPRRRNAPRGGDLPGRDVSAVVGAEAGQPVGQIRLLLLGVEL